MNACESGDHADLDVLTGRQPERRGGRLLPCRTGRSVQACLMLNTAAGYRYGIAGECVRIIPFWRPDLCRRRGRLWATAMQDV
jgi:hypothetical protein